MHVCRSFSEDGRAMSAVVIFSGWFAQTGHTMHDRRADTNRGDRQGGCWHNVTRHVKPPQSARILPFWDTDVHRWVLGGASAAAARLPTPAYRPDGDAQFGTCPQLWPLVAFSGCAAISQRERGYFRPAKTHKKAAQKPQRCLSPSERRHRTCPCFSSH